MHHSQITPRSAGRFVLVTLIALCTASAASGCAPNPRESAAPPLPDSAPELRAAIESDRTRLKALVVQARQAETSALAENDEFIEIAERLPQMQQALEDLEAQERRAGAGSTSP